MSSFFGRRHSISGGHPVEDDSVNRIIRHRRASNPDVPVQEVGIHTRFRDLFRRRRDDSPVGVAASPCAVSEPESAACHPPPAVVKPHGRNTSHHHRQDSGIHVHTSASDGEKSAASGTPSARHQLTRKDVEAIFSGAPYFMLEKGKQDHWYPHVIFPFDDHDPTIQSLWDRRALPYASYTLCTLHAHLPIPDNWMIEGEAPVHLDGWRRTGGPKRASFDVGIFEVPNMLSLDGKEPGSIGFHHFLELPVADSLRFTGPVHATASADFLRLSSMPATEAYELMEHYNDPYAQCADGTVHERKKLLRDGPSAWKRIGVRDIDLNHLVERLQTLRDLRYEILHGQKTKTILDLEGPRELFSGLFTKFLYPPSRFMLVEGEEPCSIQSQIKALTLVLAAPGAWLDFSLVEWRLHIGQLLWETPPHAEGDFLDTSIRDRPWIHPTLERKWFLVQMILAAELLLRLDATVRVGLLQNSHELRISARDIQDFDRLRTSKVNWDLVAVRRFMDCFNFTYNPVQVEPLYNIHSAEASKTDEKRTHHSFLENLTRRPSFPMKMRDESAWRCNHSPLNVDRQLQGLFVFAENIGWPRIDDLKEHFQSEFADDKCQKIKDAFNNPVRNLSSGGLAKQCTRKSMYTRSLTYRPLLLQCTRNSPDVANIGGWITRSWLSGFVLPGEGMSHLLMATIFENDADAMARLGPIVNLYGGFSYRGRSWWSKECIVGRVLSGLCGTKVCMGWLGSPILPKEACTRDSLDNTWFEVAVKEPQSWPGKPRIKQANRISFESTPLGLGDLTSGAFSLPTDGPLDRGPNIKVNFDTLVFSTKAAPEQQQKQAAEECHPVVAHKASAVFSLTSDRRKLPGTISFPLTYNVRFISSHECRPPGGFIQQSAPATPAESGRSSASSSPPPRKNHHRLPGHPLHRSYTYRFIPLDSLPELPESGSCLAVEPGGLLNRHEIMVLDARGSPEKETFARAWCASVGYHAILGRVGRTCLACCIREARAVKVRVVIRVGDGCPSRPLSKVNSASESCPVETPGTEPSPRG